jgi:hypothetical protein
MAMIVLQGGTEVKVEASTKGVQKALSENQNQGGYCALKRSGDEGRVLVKPEAVVAMYDTEGKAARAGAAKAAGTGAAKAAGAAGKGSSAKESPKKG